MLSHLGTKKVKKNAECFLWKIFWSTTWNKKKKISFSSDINYPYGTPAWPSYYWDPQQNQLFPVNRTKRKIPCNCFVFNGNWCLWWFLVKIKIILESWKWISHLKYIEFYLTYYFFFLGQRYQVTLSHKLYVQSLGICRKNGEGHTRIEKNNFWMTLAMGIQTCISPDDALNV